MPNVRNMAYYCVGFLHQGAMHGIDFGSSHRDGLGFDRLLHEFLRAQMTFDIVDTGHCDGSWSANVT